MPQRPLTKYLPGLEPLEHKQLLSAGPTTRALEHVASGSKELASHPADTSSTASAGVATPSKGQKVETPATPQKKPTTGFLMYRITNPNRYNKGLNPPFAQVLVQPNQPVAGHTYNILWVIARNGTAQTFNASSGFYVRFPTSNYTVPILTGNEEWKPGQRIVFYVLTQKYYPLPSQVHSGFEFNLAVRGQSRFPGHRRSPCGSSTIPRRSIIHLIISLSLDRETREGPARSTDCRTQLSASSFSQLPIATISPGISS